MISTDSSLAYSINYYSYTYLYRFVVFTPLISYSGVRWWIHSYLTGSEIWCWILPTPAIVLEALISLNICSSPATISFLVIIESIHARAHTHSSNFVPKICIIPLAWTIPFKILGFPFTVRMELDVQCNIINYLRSSKEEDQWSP